MKIIPGAAERVYFYVQYSPSSVTPKLLAIRLNGKEICNFIIKTPMKPSYVFLFSDDFNHEIYSHNQYAPW